MMLGMLPEGQYSSEPYAISVTPPTSDDGLLTNAPLGGGSDLFSTNWQK
jgi:hypothetical protein